jgi:hypothetical protein
MEHNLSTLRTAKAGDAHRPKGRSQVPGQMIREQKDNEPPASPTQLQLQLQHGPGFKMHMGQTDDGAWVHNMVASNMDTSMFLCDCQFHLVANDLV